MMKYLLVLWLGFMITGCDTASVPPTSPSRTPSYSTTLPQSKTVLPDLVVNKMPQIGNGSSTVYFYVQNSEGEGSTAKATPSTAKLEMFITRQDNSVVSTSYEAPMAEIQAGAEQIVEVSNELLKQVKSVRLRLSADIYNKVAERSETNNTLDITIAPK